MVQRYRMTGSAKKQQKQPENYNSVLPRIISSPRSREVAEKYIQNADFQEKMAITRMLNEWNKETFSIEESASVIRPEAVPVIKNWLNQAESNDVSYAKNLLSHISSEKKKSEEVATRNSPRPATKGSRSRPLSKQSSRPSTTYSSHSETKNAKPMTANGKRKPTARPTLRPKTSITYGSFYPSSYEGFGNNTSHFNVIRSNVQPKPLISKAESYRQKYHNKEAETAAEPFNPVNRSSIFGNIVYPLPQETSIAPNGSLSERYTVRSRPATQGNQQKMPSSALNSRPTTQHAATRNMSRPGSRPTTQHQLRKQWSDDKLKFSANLQNENDRDEIPPIDTSPQPPNDTKQVTYYCNPDSFRAIGLGKHWPGRPYNNTSFLLS